MVVEGPLLVYGPAALLFRVPDVTDLNHHVEALTAPLDLVRPPPDLVIIGTGRSQREAEVGVRVRDAVRERDMGLEVLDTRGAVGMYNVLAGEGRRVLAVMWPPREVPDGK